MGEGFHAWLERHFASAPRLLDADEDAERPEAPVSALVERFREGQFADRVPDEVEIPFALFLGGQVVRGRIDAVYTDRGRVEVVDWKTGSARRAQPLQLALYRLAWAELNGLDAADVDALFYDVVHDEVVRPGGLPDRVQLESLVSRLVSPG